MSLETYDSKIEKNGVMDKSFVIFLNHSCNNQKTQAFRGKDLGSTTMKTNTLSLTHFFYTNPCSSMASATLMKPPILAPFT